MTATGQEKSIGRLGKYALLEKLGEGHLGPVYKALDQGSDRRIAVRILCDGIRWDAGLEDRFSRECRAIVELHHPNIAALFDFGKEGESHYIATEFLGGDDLGSLIARKAALTVEKKLSVMIQAAEGLGHAHSHGILHRGLKPGKIHLAPDGCPKIRDFGIAHLLRKYLARPGIRWGAPLYMPPEEIQHAECDERSDVFSAGIVFYELLTGLHPFHDQNSNKAVDRILFETDIPTIERFPDLPPGIWAILDMCLAKDPRDRYQTISDFSDACRDLLKDMAEDCQSMLAELQAALPRLRKAAARPGASRSTVTLCEGIQDLLGNEGKTDYASLDRLMSALADHYPTLKAVSGESALEPVHVPALPEESVPLVEASIPAASCSAREAAGQEPPENPYASGPDGGASPADSAVEPERDFPDQLPLVLPLRPSYAYRTVPRPSFRVTAALLSVLLIVTAAYLVRGTGAAASLRTAWSTYLPGSSGKVSAPGPTALPQRPPDLKGTAGGELQSENAGQVTVKVLLEEARALASQRRLYESRVLIQRILELSPNNEAAVAMLEDMDAALGHGGGSNGTPKELQAELSRVSNLIRAGKLQPAKAGLDRLQLNYPDAPELAALRKRWETRNSLAARDQAHKEDEERTAAQQRKQEEWTRRVEDLYTQGNYSEARGALTLWLADDAANPRARDLMDRTEAVQRNLQTCESALAGGRYQDALNAIDLVARLNPADPSIAEMRRRVDARKATARATLTVRRLGDRATLLLDGRPAGTEGEIRSESVGIGHHTIGVENAAGYHASRNQEFLEGQTVTYVYDTAAQLLRPMTDTDVGLIAQRDIKEELHRFKVEHGHGMLRGSCKGVLSFNYFEVEFKSDSGWHGFQVPFKQLMLKADGRSIDFFLASTGKYFHSFKAQNPQEAESLRRTWEKLAAGAQ
jgi:serine/threonine protein kinase/tetratricopeptide (TPR) repeat protein